MTAKKWRVGWGILLAIACSVSCVEQGGEPALALDLHDQGVQALGRGHPGQRCGDGGFAHPALARNDDHPCCAEEVSGLHPRRG